MSGRPPVWIDPRLAIIEAGASFGWDEIDAQAEAWPDARPLVAGPGSVTGLVAALVAAERRDLPILLARRDTPAEATAEPIAGGFSITLLTSGTTGAPKRATHDFARLAGRVAAPRDGAAPRWLLTYEPTAFAGLQVILTALRAGAILIAEPSGGLEDLARASLAHGATHVSGTPTFWRGFLMALDGRAPPLRAVTLGGEAADQPLLDRLAAGFPEARLRHIYASTEAGAVFAVTDGRAGFPAAWLTDGIEGARLRVVEDALEVLSPRAMTGARGLTADGWLMTGDLVEIIGDRVLFAGRRDSVVNIGGAKVLPERIERGLLGVPGVLDAAVTARPSPITGAILVADIVRDPAFTEEATRAAIGAHAAGLAPAERPRRVTFVERLATRAGKKPRSAAPGIPS